ncbi:hypothetical protein [Clostridium butyricum]|uniref:hypothetical protein n=1 Tax=Clostridium butyricum TaxID=1492 RepID=UPI0021055860|nr:hypothetical protein [Clostridium butyricum]MCQ2012915.1 hypothetical protein [Clostridium butyricum]MCQ2025299.1 hypothetical protein [Clostridium butyricum]
MNKIPNRIMDNEQIEIMIEYINNCLKDLDIIILERENASEKDTFTVEPRSIYEEKIKRESSGQKTIPDKNVLTYWQYKDKIILSSRQGLNPSKNTSNCTFTNISQLEKLDINKIIHEKYRSLVNNENYLLII